MATFNNLDITCGCAWFACHRKSLSHEGSDAASGHTHVANPPKIQRGGWRSIPYILMSEFAERLATIGLALNLITYLMGFYHMSQVRAASILGIVSGTASLMPIVGSFLSDTYLGRFQTLVLGSVSQFIASILLTTTAACPSLRPPTKSREGPSPGQLAFLFASLGMTTVAAGALRPCTYAFGTDQLIQQGGDTLQEKKQTQSFFNWYFFFLYCAVLTSATMLVYIQDNEGWVWGFLVPATFNVIALMLLLLGCNKFRYVPPTGSPFTVFARVLVAAIRKAKHSLPSEDFALYHGKNASPEQAYINLSHTKHLKWLDHAAIVTDSDIDIAPEGRMIGRSFRLCTVNEVEQLKALIALMPIWMINLLSTTVLSCQGAFNVPQATRMDRHIGSSGFIIPPASMSVFASITLILWMPFYDRVLVPKVRKMTGHPGGIKVLQRIGIGFFLTIVAMVVSGLVEMWRRRLGRRNEKLSAMWLVPQHCILGLGEAFHTVGQLEFLYDQLENNMRTVAGAVFWCSIGIGHYMGILIIQLVNHFTTAAGLDWLMDDLNRGHLDYFFFLLAILQTANFLLFLIVCHCYTYRCSAQPSTSTQGLELSEVNG